MPVQRILSVPNPPQRQRRQRSRANIFRRPTRGHRNQQAQPFIKINQRRRAPLYASRRILMDSGRSSSRWNNALPAAVAATRLLGWTPRYLKHRFALLARPAPAQPRHYFRQCQFIIDYRCQRNRVLVQLMSQRLSLRQCSSEAVQNKAAAASQTPLRSRSISHTVESGTSAPRRI
jgi:hypothetical protein